jgi:hypothetical protein
VLLNAVFANAQSNPVPFLNQSLTPPSVAPGGSSIVLKVSGAGFVSGSAIQWNGKALPSKVVTPGLMTATVPAADVAKSATAMVTVKNPTPAGGSSAVQLFSVSQPGVPAFTPYGVSYPQAPAHTLTSPIVVDVNGDGISDLVFGYGSHFGVMLGVGDGSFQVATLFDIPGATQAAVTTAGDFDGDGKLDVAFVPGYGSANPGNILVIRGNGDGTFASPLTLSGASGYEADFLVAGDFNRDGKLDLLAGDNATTGGTSAQLEMFLGNGDGTFQAGRNYPAGQFLYNLTTGDVNGDGVLDLILEGSSGSTWLGKGDGTFSSPVPFAAFPAFQIALADVDGDGQLDLISVDGKMNVSLGKGDGTFKSPHTYTSADTYLYLAIADVNADGVLDVISTNATSVVWFQGVGDGTFKPATPYTGARPGPLVAADFNNDGRMDLFVAPNSSTQIDRVLLQGNFPQLTVNQPMLTFGQQRSSTTSAGQNLTLSNTGKAALTISGISMTGADAEDFAQTNKCGTSLAVNATCTVTVSFTPSAQGTKTASLSISNNAPGGSQGVAVSGTAPTPALTLSTSAVTFGGLSVGTTALPQTVTVTNTGALAVDISNVAVSPADFSIVNSCGASLAAGATCSIGVSFNPATSGSKPGTLTISNSASTTPQTVALDGMGQDFQIAASASSNTVVSGETASWLVTVNPIAGFNQAVALGCGGAPAGTTCTLTQNSVSLSDSTPVTFTVSVTTIAGSVRHPAANVAKGQGEPSQLLVCGLPGVVMLVLPTLWSRRSRVGKALLLMGVLAFSLFSITGCGGVQQAAKLSGTPASTYNLVITGTSAAGTSVLTHTADLTLRVQ